MRSALVHWRLVLIVFAVSLLGGCIFMASTWVWLASALDSSLATRTLLTSLDANVFIDLAAHERSSLRMLALLTLILVSGGSVVSIALNGMVLAMVSGRLQSLAEACHVSLGRYFVLAKLWVAAVTADALAIFGIYIGGQLLIRWTAASSNDLLYYGIVATGAVAGAAVVLTIATIHDHGRIRCLETGDGAVRSGLWACAYVIRERRAVPLALLLMFTAAAGWVVYQTAGSLVSADSGLGLTVSLVWAQGFMVFRAFVRVWAFASATELQGRWENT